MREVRWERMFPDQLEAAFAARPVVYFPYGLCEPHGPHAAVGLDALKAHAIACRTARGFGGIVAPADYWHIHEIGTFALWSEEWIGQVARTWITALPPWQHFKNVCYHIRTAEMLGFHAAIFLTGHYGANWEDLKTLLQLVQPHVGTRLYGLPDFEANTLGFTGDGKNHRDHAGRVETSQLWAVEPELVDMSRLPPPDSPGPHFAMGPTAREADRRIGERMIEAQAGALAEKARALLADYAAQRAEHRLLTFDAVERLWDDVVRPALPSFKTMQDDCVANRSLPSSSRWYPNWRVPRRS